jgi:hypothetical protein
LHNQTDKKKKELILFLANVNSFEKIVVAPTLAWIAHSTDRLFDNYYSGYRTGVHYAGGKENKPGDILGGTVSGGRHFESFYLLLNSFDVSTASLGTSLFHSCAENLGVSRLVYADRLHDFYTGVFTNMKCSKPTTAVMIGKAKSGQLNGIETYFYPEIYYRSALGLTDAIMEEEFGDLLPEGSRVFTIFVSGDKIQRLRARGYQISELENADTKDDYETVIARIVGRWSVNAKGWILGDPDLVSHLVPKACEEGLIAAHSIPQSRIINKLESVMRDKGQVVYGRQTDDSDFFTLSRLNKAFQVIDPCRPPFHSMRHLEYQWDGDLKDASQAEPSDEKLKQYAEEGKILISLIFWTGMIRELENLYNLVELIALTKLKCALALTAQSFEYMMHHPMEALAVHLDDGGIYPLAEPMLASCGIGVGIESVYAPVFLENGLDQGMERIKHKVKDKRLQPKGWWVTLDVDLKKRPWWKRPGWIKFNRHSPRIQIRHHKVTRSNSVVKGTTGVNFNSPLKSRIKQTLARRNWQKYFLPYRPYEFYAPEAFKNEMVSVAKGADLKYMFSKSSFNGAPKIHHIDEDFIALNYTAGQWDGWTPFVTVNNLHDLRKSVKNLTKRNKPGWVISTIDACLWTFSGHIWEKGRTLHEIASFCSRGGDSGRLVNVHPYTIARYARIMAQKGLLH